MGEKLYRKINNIYTIEGRTASLVNGFAYAAAKGGIIVFTRCLAKEVGKLGGNVNAIAPGTVLLGQRMNDLWNKLSEAEKDNIVNSIHLVRLSSAEEQVAVIDVNGGRFMG